MATKIISVPFESIYIDEGFNARKDYDDIEQLAASIRANGLLEPVGVLAVKDSGNTRYKVVYGARRYKALVLIRETEPDAFATLDVVLSSAGTTAELQLANLSENVERNCLKPWEIAGRIKELVNLGFEQRDIAARLGRPQSWVSYFFKLSTKLNPSAWKAFTEDKLTMEQALNIADIPEDTQTDIVDRIINADTRAEARKIAKEASRTKGTRREYSNKGRPTFKNLTSLMEDISFEGTSDIYDTTEKSFFNGVAAGLRISLGTLEFKAVDPAEAYFDVSYGATLKSAVSEVEEEVVPVKPKVKRKSKATK